MPSPAKSCPGPLSRRQFLQFGALGLGGLGLNNLLSLRAATREAGQSAPDTSVIFIWLPGGPPHMETYDMKPNAPAEYRGDFRPIKTVVPGLDVCELLPETRPDRGSLYPDSFGRASVRRPRRGPQALPYRARPGFACRLC